MTKQQKIKSTIFKTISILFFAIILSLVAGHAAEDVYASNLYTDEETGYVYYYDPDQDTWFFKGVSDTSITSVTIPKTITINGSKKTVKVNENAVLNPTMKEVTVNCPIAISTTSTLHTLFEGSAITKLIVNSDITQYVYFPPKCNTIIFNGDLVETPLFNNCTTLSSIIYNGDASIYSGYSLYSYYPDSVTTIQFNGHLDAYPYFGNASSIKKITFKNCSETTLPNGMFYNCKKLQTISLPSNLTKISDNAFYNCSALKSITIPSKVTTIGSFAFYNCKKLYQVIFTKNTSSISDYAFYECNPSLLTIVAPSGSKAQSYAKKNNFRTITTKSLKINKGVTKTYVGGKLQIIVYNNPSTVKYSTSNKNVATVSSSGIITGKKAGTATIKVTVSGKAYSYKYTVVKRTQSNVLSIIDTYYVKSSMSDYQKIVAADAWLAANVDYDYTNFLSNTVPMISHTAKGAFEKGVAVCDGYAYAFKSIMDHYGISCICVHNRDHMWNEVKLGSKWYFVDTTFDDPVISGTNHTERISTQKYLLKTTSVIKEAQGSTAYWSKYYTANSKPSTYNKQINHTGYKKAVINRTTASIVKGKTTTIKVSGTSARVAYSSSDRSILTVSSKGVVKGKKAGTAYVNVKIGSRTYKVKVTVKS